MVIFHGYVNLPEATCSWTMTKSDDSLRRSDQSNSGVRKKMVVHGVYMDKNAELHSKAQEVHGKESGSGSGGHYPKGLGNYKDSKIQSDII